MKGTLRNFAEIPLSKGAIMRNKWKYIKLLALLLIMLAVPAKASAHGAHIQYTSSTIEITAKYDNGEPMSGAQITIYAPDDLSNAWQTGTLDDDGHFAFTPDTSKPGNWKVKVRLGGHGDIITIPIAEDGVGSSGDGSYSVLQIVLMSVCVVWGATGTALFFIRRRKA